MAVESVDMYTFVANCDTFTKVQKKDPQMANNARTHACTHTHTHTLNKIHFQNTAIIQVFKNVFYKMVSFIEITKGLLNSSHIPK